jgi:hypothetical protein
LKTIKTVVKVTLLFAAIAYPAGKFSKSAEFTLPHGCGNGLDENSPIGACVYVGVAVTKYASGGHVCVDLPAGKTDKDMRLTPSAGEASANTVYTPCGNPGPCQIGWSRFESAEYYADKNQMCGRFKNWSADRDRKFKIEVVEK